MRSLLAAWIAASALGCGTIWVDKPESGPYHHIPTAVWPEASLNGPIVEGSRVAGWSTFSAGSSAAAVARNRSGYAGAAASASASGTSVVYEHYQSADLQEFLQKLLE